MMALKAKANVATRIGMKYCYPSHFFLPLFTQFCLPSLRFASTVSHSLPTQYQTYRRYAFREITDEDRRRNDRLMERFRFGGRH